MVLLEIFSLYDILTHEFVQALAHTAVRHAEDVMNVGGLGMLLLENFSLCDFH